MLWLWLRWFPVGGPDPGPALGGRLDTVDEFRPAVIKNDLFECL